MNKSQEVIIIAAMAENRVIGKDNAIPWLVKGNLAHFKEMTMGWPCVMGRKTWESLPKRPLLGRLNIIVSSMGKPSSVPKMSSRASSVPQTSLNSSSVPKDEQKSELCPQEKPQALSPIPSSPIFLPSLTAAIEHCAGYKKVFICGGESIYKQALSLASVIDLTLIPGNYDGDTYFPEIDGSWLKTDTVSYEEFSVITYKKIKKEQI
ncbi:MAG: dihydrofolate reductase [Treponema sp.]|nr:dihydrofolate reductase [Treponema sp.]